MTLTGVQCRMARAGLGINVRDLAKMANVAPDTINRLENKGAELRGSTAAKIERVLTEAGARFNGKGGVTCPHC